MYAIEAPNPTRPPIAPYIANLLSFLAKSLCPFKSIRPNPNYIYLDEVRAEMIHSFSK